MVEPFFVCGHAVLNAAARFPAQFLELGDVGADVPRVAEAVFSARFWVIVLSPEDLGDGFGEFRNGVGLAATDVEHFIIGPIVVEGEEVGIDNVEHVHKIANLLAILVDLRLLVLMKAETKDTTRAAIRVVKTLPRALNDGVAHGD